MTRLRLVIKGKIHLTKIVPSNNLIYACSWCFLAVYRGRTTPGLKHTKFGTIAICVRGPANNPRSRNIQIFRWVGF